MELNKCQCGSVIQERWFQYKRGKQIVQIRCSSCGIHTKPCKTIRRAERAWNHIQKKP